MKEFGKSYCGSIKKLSEEGLVRLRTPGHDKLFPNMHDGNKHQKRALEILGTPTVSVQGEICYHENLSVQGLCGATDRQFSLTVTPGHDFYRRALIISIKGIPVGIMKGFILDLQIEHEHFCSLKTFTSPKGYGMYFGGIYSPVSKQASSLMDMISDKMERILDTIASGKWPVIDVPGLDLVPRRFVGGGMSPQDLPALYESLQRESKLLNEQFKQNAVVISR